MRRVGGPGGARHVSDHRRRRAQPGLADRLCRCPSLAGRHHDRRATHRRRAQDPADRAAAMTSRRDEWLARAGLVMVSLVVALMMLELGCRLLRGPDWLFNWRNLVLKERIDTKSQGIGRLKPEPLLGFVTVPGFGRDGL